MTWQIKFLPELEDDLACSTILFARDIERHRKFKNPGYPNGYGKPLGNLRQHLAGCQDQVQEGRSAYRIRPAKQQGPYDRHHFRPRG